MSLMNAFRKDLRAYDSLIHTRLDLVWIVSTSRLVQEKVQGRSSLSSHSIVIIEMAELPPAKPIRMSRTTKDVLSGEKPNPILI